MMNSRVSRQWFCDRKAVKALNVHGGGAVLANISPREGNLMAGEAVRGMARLDGREVSMAVSASQSSWTEDGGVISLRVGFM